MFKHLLRFIGMSAILMVATPAWSTDNWHCCGTSRYPIGPYGTSCVSCPTNVSDDATYPRKYLMSGCGSSCQTSCEYQTQPWNACATNNPHWGCSQAPQLGGYTSSRLSLIRQMPKTNTSDYDTVRDCTFCEDYEADDTSLSYWRLFYCGSSSGSCISSLSDLQSTFNNMSGQDANGKWISGVWNTRYPVFSSSSDTSTQVPYTQSVANTNPLTHCMQCPKLTQNERWSMGIASCSYDGFECRGVYNKVKVTGKYDPLSNQNGAGYECQCSGNWKNNYGNDAGPVYVGWDGYCGRCPINQGTYYDQWTKMKTCNNTTYTCADGYYRAVNGSYGSISKADDPGLGASLTSVYGAYICTACPHIANADDLGLTANYLGGSMGVTGTFSTTSRCTVTTNERTWADPTSGNVTECKYRLTNLKPVSSCAGTTSTATVLHSVEYSLEADPDYGYLKDAGSCNYTATTTYTYAPEGWGWSGGVCAPCPSGTYSTESMTTCQSAPAHGVVDDDGQDFYCESGYYKSGSECVPCPIDFEIGYYGLGNLGNSTTAGQSLVGADALSECYVERGSSGNNASGYYTTGSMCYASGQWHSSGYVLCLDNGNYFNPSDSSSPCYSAAHDYLQTKYGCRDYYDEMPNCMMSHILQYTVNASNPYNTTCQALATSNDPMSWYSGQGILDWDTALDIVNNVGSQGCPMWILVR